LREKYKADEAVIPVPIADIVCATFKLTRFKEGSKFLNRELKTRRVELVRAMQEFDRSRQLIKKKRRYPDLKL
jgi:hypothetical protein